MVTVRVLKSPLAFQCSGNACGQVSELVIICIHTRIVASGHGMKWQCTVNIAGMVFVANHCGLSEKLENNSVGCLKNTILVRPLRLMFCFLGQSRLIYGSVGWQKLWLKVISCTV